MERKKFNYSNLSPREHYELEEEERAWLSGHITVETHPGLPHEEELDGFSLTLIREFHDRYHNATK